jgi:hypothetical protein
MAALTGICHPLLTHFLMALQTKVILICPVANGGLAGVKVRGKVRR